MYNRATLAVLFGVVLTACGCNPEPLTLPPLSGTLRTADDKPVTAGGLIFIPESGTWGGNVVNASLNPDGTFSATTSRTTDSRTRTIDGAPAGRYKVVYHPPGDGQALGLEVELPDVVTVGPQENVLKLVLPEKKPADKKADPPADKPTGEE